MKKRVTIISFIVLVALIVISFCLILNKNNKKKSIENKIVSIMDINPNIKFVLDENDIVTNTIALNDETSVIVIDDKKWKNKNVQIIETCITDEAKKISEEYNISINQATEYAKAAINASSLGIKGSSLSRVDDNRSSYCRSYQFMGYNDDNKYHVTIDSVTGSVIEQKVVSMDKPKITEEEAKSIGVNKFGIDPSFCDFVQAYFSMNNEKLRYSFASRCSGTYYSLEIDAMTGAVSKERTWT